MRRRLLGPEHPSTLTTMHNLAGFFQIGGRYGKAEPLYRQVFEISAARSARSTPTPCHNAGLALLSRRMAIRRLPNPWSSSCSRSGAGHRMPKALQLAYALNLLSRNLLLQRRYAEAEPWLASP